MIVRIEGINMIVRIEGVNMIVGIDKGKLKDFCGIAKLLHECGP